MAGLRGEPCWVRTSDLLIKSQLVGIPTDYYAFLQRTNAPAPSGNVLGLLAKANVNPRQAGTWATVVSYDAIGYVQPETSSGLSDPNFEGSVRSARVLWRASARSH